MYYWYLTLKNLILSLMQNSSLAKMIINGVYNVSWSISFKFFKNYFYLFIFMCVYLSHLSSPIDAFLDFLPKQWWYLQVFLLVLCWSYKKVSPVVFSHIFVSFSNGCSVVWLKWSGMSVTCPVTRSNCYHTAIWPSVMKKWYRLTMTCSYLAMLKCIY